MRAVSEAGLRLIRDFEGFSPVVYHDAAGHPTIGYGHLIRDGEDFSGGITRAAALELLRADVRVAQAGVLRLIQVPLTDGQYDALVSFTFNLGSGALQRSTLRRKVNRKEHADVPDELRRWVYAGGRRLRGLVRRREAEARIYAGGLLPRSEL